MFSLRILLLALLVHVCFNSNFGSARKGQRYRIISGRLADITEFPYQANIDYHYQQWCGGSVISRRAILTAAHCVQSVRELRNVPESVMRIRLGSPSSSWGGTIYAIKQFIVYPKYDDTREVDDHDIAIIITSKKIEYGDTVKPIAVATVEPRPGDMCWVTGYGRQEPMKRAADSRHLMAVEIPIVDRERCKQIHRKTGNVVTSNMICAGFDTGSKDSCKGDSGGPLVCNNTQAGVVAWGLGCGREGMPGVYTNVFRYQKWIKRKLKAVEDNANS